jgi:predicted nucleic acid-binding protein
MADYGLDSSIIFPRIKGDKALTRKINEALAADSLIMIPPHAYYETMRGLEDHRAAKQARMFDGLLEQCPLGEAKQELFDEAAHIYNELRRAGTPSTDDGDILIAAFCRLYGLTLVTDNTRHFAAIAGLSLENWLEETSA